MQKDVLGVALLALFSVACSSAINPPVQVENGPHDLYHVCGIAEMAEGTGAVQLNDLPEPIRVRQIRGRITYEGWDGSWFENTWPILKLRGPGKSQKTYEVHGDMKGHFVLKYLPEGQYCFLASANCSGYQGIYGIIIVDKNADKKNEIEIKLPWAWLAKDSQRRGEEPKWASSRG